MKHDFITSAECNCDSPQCPVCVGGLAICKVCGLAEGCLTTDCPGEKIKAGCQDAIYDGLLDFSNGQWRYLPNPTNQTFIKFWASTKDKD